MSTQISDNQRISVDGHAIERMGEKKAFSSSNRRETEFDQ